MRAVAGLPRVQAMSTPAHPASFLACRPTTLVTGASSGIGRALALQLAAQGVPVLALARRADALHALKAAHPSWPLEVWPADLGALDGLPALARALRQAHPRLAAVIHNAGQQQDLRLDAPGYEAPALRSELDLNLAAPMILTQALLPHLQQQPRAWVLGVGSVLGLVPKRRAAVYSASKAGLALFLDGLRVQLRETHPTLQVLHALMPLVDTAMTAGRRQAKLSPEAAAAALLQALSGPRPGGRSGVIAIGRARLARPLQRWLPALLARGLQAPETASRPSTTDTEVQR